MRLINQIISDSFNVNKKENEQHSIHKKKQLAILSLSIGWWGNVLVNSNSPPCDLQ